MELKDILKDLRLKNNLTLEELADRLNKYDGVNISKGTISRWENGSREPKNTYVSAYAKEFNIDLNILYGLGDYKKEETDTIPEKFTTPQEAMHFLLHQQTIMGFNGLDISKLPEDEQVDYANEVLNMMKLVSLKYKDKRK